MKKTILLIAICILSFGKDSNLKYYEDVDNLSQNAKNHIEQNEDFYTKGFLESMNLQRGQKVYRDACENCHGVNGDKSLIKNLKDYDEESLQAVIRDYMYNVVDPNTSSTMSLKQMLLEGYSSADIRNMIAYIKLKEE